MQDKLFQFKQFDLSQQNCAMRIGTDGLLLGAWAGQNLCDHREVHDILDLGCGCGLISLMLAQRYNNAHVYAVEIDELAAQTAGRNALASPFASRVQIFCGDVRQLPPEITERRYDLIASNPPYFRNSIPSADPLRSRARHQRHGFDYDTLFKLAAQLLNATGILCIITPYDQQRHLTTLAINNNLLPVHILPIRTVESKDPKRLLSAWGKANVSPPEKEAKEDTPFTIHSTDGKHSPAYQALTAPFHPWVTGE